MVRRSLLSSLWSAFKWIFFRMPFAFSATFALISLWWAFNGFKYADPLVFRHVKGMTTGLVHLLPAPLPNSFIFTRLVHPENIDALIVAAVTIASCIVGFLVAYNVAAAVNWLVSRALPKTVKCHCGFVPVRPEDKAPCAPFSEATRIGIVLAGGGAKGAYQAGAMTAIYQFLEQHNALNRVKVIAGTSVGSWNAMFWLAGMIRAPNGWGEPGCLEWWWKRLNSRGLVAPRLFIPTFQNAFLSSGPWRRQFDQIFGSQETRKMLFDCDIHFYMTRSNVGSGRLECATNNPDPPAVNRIDYDKLKDATDCDDFFARIKTAVFASMDLPPLFPYERSKNNYYEDGGIIENLPVSFPARENCDLIFVLPLNADFETEPNNRSLLARISRVMDVQQGALERHGFKLMYLYNENAALRELLKAAMKENEGVREAVNNVTGNDDNRMTSLVAALQRTNIHIKTFAVCPDKSFVQTTLDTRDLWNKKGAEMAFDVMYKQTAQLLKTFNFAKPQEKIAVALIKKSGSYTLDPNF